MEIGKDWFTDWFGTKYYSILYSNRDYTEAEYFLSKITNTLVLPEKAKVLDLACGRGRHSRYLANMGYNVTGIDISEEALSEANKFKTRSLKFIMHDIREEFKLNYFNLVVNLFTSFGYFETEEEDQIAIKQAYKSCKKNGYFIFDYLHSDIVIDSLLEFEEIVKEDVYFKVRRLVKGGFIVKLIEVVDGGINRFFAERVRAYAPNQINDLMTNAGFKIEHIYGDYELNPFMPETSPRIIYVCRKK
jgi:SAM-dependent methyltransferase